MGRKLSGTKGSSAYLGVKKTYDGRSAGLGRLGGPRARLRGLPTSYGAPGGYPAGTIVTYLRQHPLVEGYTVHSNATGKPTMVDIHVRRGEMALAQLDSRDKNGKLQISNGHEGILNAFAGRGFNSAAYVFYDKRGNPLSNNGNKFILKDGTPATLATIRLIPSKGVRWDDAKTRDIVFAPERAVVGIAKRHAAQGARPSISGRIRDASFTVPTLEGKTFSADVGYVLYNRQSRAADKSLMQATFMELLNHARKPNAGALRVNLR